jgi:hypothetical protein
VVDVEPVPKPDRLLFVFCEPVPVVPVPVVPTAPVPPPTVDIPPVAEVDIGDREPDAIFIPPLVEPPAVDDAMPPLDGTVEVPPVPPPPPPLEPPPPPPPPAVGTLLVGVVSVAVFTFGVVI